MLRRLLAAVVLTAAVVPPSAASAQAPGDADYWSYIRKDAFKHYACRTKEKDGDYTVRTASFDNGNAGRGRPGIGVYTAIARGSEQERRDPPDARRRGAAHYARDDAAQHALRPTGSGCRAPTTARSDPWSDGFTVNKLVRCDPR